jgi:multidrug efflux pump subunit AcrA (membrane-fusion protein)
MISRPVNSRDRSCRFVTAIALIVVACGKGSEARKPDSAQEASGAATRESSEEQTTPKDGPVRVTLSPAAVATARIVVEAVRAESTTAASSGLDVPGQVDYEPSRVALISPRTSGRVERLTVVEGAHVVAGQPVAYLSSPNFLTAQADLQQAARRAAMLAGTPDAEGANALVAAARRRLRLLGAGDALIQRVEKGAEPATELPIVAPFSGTIVEAQAMAGAAVEAGAPLFRIADLSVVDVTAQVPERALSFLRIDQGATVGIAAYPAMRFTGRVERIKAELDPSTRTVKAILHVTNSSGALRPGMFASVRLNVPLAAAARGAGGAATGPYIAPTLTISDAAVMSEGDRRYVFVQVGPQTYERRAVQITSAAPTGAATAESGRVVVLAGLHSGEHVVVNGAFTLRSELAKGSLNED